MSLTYKACLTVYVKACASDLTFDLTFDLPSCHEVLDHLHNALQHLTLSFVMIKECIIDHMVQDFNAIHMLVKMSDLLCTHIT